MAKPLRISGLVRMADAVRRELSVPLSPQQRNRLQSRVSQTLASLEKTAKEVGSSLNRLPSPSRRALHFLKSIEWEKAPIAENGAAGPARRHVSFSGLSRWFDRTLNYLSDSPDEDELAAILSSIQRNSRQIEGTIRLQKIEPDELSAASRDLRGWLAFFSRSENLSAYCKAIVQIKAAIEPLAIGQNRFSPPLRIHFRPMRGIFQMRRERRGTLLKLPTPMVAFNPGAFADMAEMIFGRDPSAKSRIIEQMASDNVMAVRSKLEALGGIGQSDRGTFHDLDASFTRVNDRYFAGGIAKPRLAWSVTFTGRKFGHYDWIGDSIMISRTLDSPQVPSFVVDFVMYHELLHKKHGLRWANGRGMAHTAGFYREERLFAEYEQAEAALQKLTKMPR